MAGRGWLKSRLAELNANKFEEPSKPIDNISKVPITVESNSIYHSQTNNVKTPVLVSHNSINQQDLNITFKHNDIHQQDKNIIVNGNCIHHSQSINDVAKTTSPVLTNGIQPQVVRGRRALIDKISQLMLSDDTATGFSSLENGNDVMFQPFSQSQVYKTVVPNMSLPTTQALSNSMVNPQKQLIPIETQEEAPPTEYRVLPNSKSDKCVIKPLSSNYIKLDVDKNKGVYEYCVAFDPPIDAKPMKFYSINQHRELFPIKIFDGELLFVPTLLSDKVTVLKSKLKDESEVTIKITFRIKRSIQESVKFYNIFMHSIMKTMKFVQFGRHCYNPDKRICLEDYQLEIWPGFVTAINEYDGGLFLCCDIAHRILRFQTVLDVMLDIGKNTKLENGNKYDVLMAKLCGSIIITRYNNKTYRIDDLDFKSNPSLTFNQDGREVSYVDYYKNNYSLQIRNLNQPMLVSRSKKKTDKDSTIYLVPELCNLTGLSEEMKSNFTLTKALHRYTSVTPDVRQKTLVDLVESVNTHQECKKKLNAWGLKFHPVPIHLEGPVYKREFIKLGNNVIKQVGVNMDWGSDVAKNAMFRSVIISDWAILFVSNDLSTARRFSNQLSNFGNDLSMKILKPKEFEVIDPNPGGFIAAINSVVQTNNNLQLVVIIFPNLREDRYNAVKKICCAQIGIPSQVIISRTLSNPSKLRSVIQKIALQINCKLGGACWAVNIPLDKTMIIGIDTYHEIKKRYCSVVGFVASMDNFFTEWFSSAIIHKNSHQEISTSFHVVMNKALDKFKQKNQGILPKKIIVYRDGISQGDISIVKELELNGLENTLKSYATDYCPAITFITVQKRINTRMFQVLDERYENPCPGSVIDNTVTRKNIFDFYLVSQHIYQGTVSPTHYIVWKNGCNLSIERVQLLSYKLCHLYYNWCGTIKVPAPVQYAHKLAYLIGENMQQLPRENLCDKLFYL